MGEGVEGLGTGECGVSTELATLRLKFPNGENALHLDSIQPHNQCWHYLGCDTYQGSWLP